MNNKGILRLIMTNVIINAPKPYGNTFKLTLPQELFEEFYEFFQAVMDEDGLCHMDQNKWRID